MLRALFFDLNGVIADDESLHLQIFQTVLKSENLSITREDYFDKDYIGMSDQDCFQAVLNENSRISSSQDLQQLIDRKAHLYQEAIQNHLVLFPGAVELVRETSRQVPLAIVSGALRQEIDLILNAGGIQPCFRTIVSAEDVQEGKPSPEGYQRALAEINQATDGSRPILPAECLVIEDTPFGVAAARAAGMKCLAVTHSCPAEKLDQAHQVVSSLEDLSLSRLRAIFHPPVLAYCPDLLFTSRITETARQTGISVEVVSTPQELEDHSASIQPGLILLDLGHRIDYAGLIQNLRRTLPDTVLVAYGSHVDQELLQSAKQAGCHEVLVRSQFVKTLPDLLRNYQQDP